MSVFRIIKGSVSTFEEAFSSIPENCRSLDMSRNDLGYRNFLEMCEIARGWSQLKAPITSLHLNNNDVHIFFNQLNNFQIDELLELFNQKHIIQFNLRGNSLGKIGKDKLIRLIHALGKTGIQSLDLSKNSLSELGEDLPEVLSAFSESNIQFLNLTENGLSSVELIPFFKAFERGPIARLNLSKNGICKKNIDELKVSFAEIPPNIKEIKIIEIFYNSYEKVCEICYCLPMSLKKLTTNIDICPEREMNLNELVFARRLYVLRSTINAEIARLDADPGYRFVDPNIFRLEALQRYLLDEHDIPELENYFCEWIQCYKENNVSPPPTYYEKFKNMFFGRSLPRSLIAAESIQTQMFEIIERFPPETSHKSALDKRCCR